MSDPMPRVVQFGERALLLDLGQAIDPEINARVHKIAARIDRGEVGVSGLGRTVPAYASLLVPYDPSLVEAERLAGLLSRLAQSTPAGIRDDGELTEIPVRYGGADGPDLVAVAERIGSSIDEVIALHASTEYRVYMLGFSPGFAYLGPLPEVLRLPRRPEPRIRVPAGSVAIAGAQAAVYPHETAGGWHLLGRTDVRLWDPAADPPARLRPGGRVRFMPS
jgi:KipI family sensor histidine kinase inhibitor